MCKKIITHEWMCQRLIKSFSGKWNQVSENTHTHTYTYSGIPTPCGSCTCWRPHCYWSWLGLTGGDSSLPLTRSPPSFHPPLRWSEAAVSSWLPACVRRLIVGQEGGGERESRFGKITSRSHRSAPHWLFWSFWVDCQCSETSHPTLRFKQSLLFLRGPAV